MALENATLTAPDISCEHCKHAIESAVSELPGVSDVDVMIESRQVTVLFNPEDVTLDQIKETMDEEGYPVSAWTTAPAPTGARPD